MAALTFLGTGCGQPTADRACSSLLLAADGCRWLLDAGEPCSRRLKALNVSFDSIDAVFISHGHSDHVGGLPMLLQGAWLEPRTRALPIYLPGELIEPLKHWLEAVYLPGSLLPFPIEYHAWEILPGLGAALAAGQVRVTASPTTHLDGLRARFDPAAHHRFRAYSLAFDWTAAGRRLVYSADLGQPDDLAPLLVRPCDLLVCELAHFTPEALFSFLQDQPVRHLCLTHPSPAQDARLEEIRRRGTARLPNTRVSAVRDTECIEF